MLLHLDEGTGLVAVDATGNGQDGIIHDALWTSGISGYALSFDGFGDYVDADLNNGITGDLTVSLWMKSKNLTGYQPRILDLGTPSSIGLQLCMFTDGRLLIDNSGGPSDEVFTTDTFNDGIWHHIAGVRRGTTYDLYVDGQFQSTASGSIPTYNRIFLGKRAAVSDEYFNGSIDEVAIYPRALSADEILAHYQVHEGNITHAPVSSFAANVTSGTAPLTVQFTDTSTNTPTSWLWSFGDGTTSFDPSPTHTYAVAGTYLVTLIVTNAAGPVSREQLRSR